MNDNRKDKFEEQINALLDGELDPLSTEALKNEAQDDRDLARAIVEAYQLQQLMDGLGVERAPASLRKKIRAIPRRERPSFWQQPAWVAAAAAVPVVALSIALLQPNSPSEDEILRAQQEVEMAFALINNARHRAGARVRTRVGQEIDGAVIDPIKDNLPFVNTEPQENAS